MNFKFLPPAAREVREAARYYEAQVTGLGFVFIGELRAAIRRIELNPQAWCPLDKTLRRCRTARFPYGVIYAIENGYILVVSVMHLHRHPDSWRKNL
jgi:hypothetical protein